MTYEEALEKLKFRIEEDLRDIKKDIVRLSGKHEAYERVLTLIASLLNEVEE